MTHERINTAIEVLSEFSDLIGNAPDGKDSLAMASALALAHGYLVEYQAHITQGHEPAEALQRTIRGELKLGDPMDGA